MENGEKFTIITAMAVILWEMYCYCLQPFSRWYSTEQ